LTTTVEINDILRQATGVHVGIRVPRDYSEDIPAFIKSYRIGGNVVSQVTDRPIFVVEAYATDNDAAEQLALDARTALSNSCDHDPNSPIYRLIYVQGIALLEDEDTPHHTRYTATYQAVFRI
jgi:hypothetical protein